MILDELNKRGFIHSMTDQAELAKLLDSQSVTFYCGFDPTADSLHVGSLLPLIAMRRFAKAGHNPIALLGSGTGMIGDPSGRSEERNLLSTEQLEKNIAGLEPQVKKIVGERCELVSNLDWLGKLSMIDFLRDVGKHFSVNSMLMRDSVKSRLENRDEGISYTEFSYMLLQAYDFLWLYQNKNCRLQIGGSDQWGNIVSGTDLIRRTCSPETPAFGLTIPLLLTSAGTKFGKTAQGTVWLDPTRTSPYRFYQFWLNSLDADVSRFLRLFTEVGDAEILDLEDQLKSAPERRIAHKRLAQEVTDLVHGVEERRKAEQASEALFGGELAGLSKQTLEDVFSEVPSSSIERLSLTTGIGIQDILVSSGAAKSKGEARRLIEGGGCYLNGTRVTSPTEQISSGALLHDSLLVIRSGKKSYYLVRAAA